MGLLIKKRVTFDFLGDEYKDAYIELRSIPVLDFEKLQKEIEALDDQKSVGFMVKALQDYFVSGQFPNEDNVLEPVTKDDLLQIDIQTATHCFAVWTGQAIDPKVNSPLTSPSITEATITE